MCLAFQVNKPSSGTWLRQALWIKDLSWGPDSRQRFLCSSRRVYSYTLLLFLCLCFSVLSHYILTGCSHASPLPPCLPHALHPLQRKCSKDGDMDAHIKSPLADWRTLLLLCFQDFQQPGTCSFFVLFLYMCWPQQASGLLNALEL